MTAILGVAPFVVAVWIFAVGVYGIVTSRHLVHLVVSLAVLQTSTYLLLLGIGFRAGASAPVFVDIPRRTPAVDAIVQSLMLTDVVVEATVVALLLSLVTQAFQRSGTLDPSELRSMRG